MIVTNIYHKVSDDVMADMSIEKWMQKNVIIATADVSVARAAEFIAQEKTGSLIIIEDDCPAGIVTETDLVRKCVAKAMDVNTTTIGDVMTRNPITVDKSSSVINAIHTMQEHKIKRLPIVDDDKLVGIITSSDVISIMAELYKMFSSNVESAVKNE